MQRLVATVLALCALGAAVPAAAAAAAPDPVAATYQRVLLRHTRWAEQQWDAAAGHYKAQDFDFAVVLGNAVLLTHPGYDAAAAGVDEATLREHTLATIRHFAASNRLNGGTEWGKTLFFDTTFQSYFVLAAHLLWNELDPSTQANVDHIVRAQADYTTSLGAGNDPLSGGWTPNGLLGGYQGDTKLEEMGVYAQSLAPGLAWASDDPGAGGWRDWFGRWSRNETGLPSADADNPDVVDGVPVSENTAHNLYDTYIVENHGSFGPHYQEELWRTSARNAIHFLLAGRPLPEVLTHQPNAAGLWKTILAVMSDAGEPLMPMVDDREHLYGRDVIPLAFLAQVQGDRDAARAEADLADRLEAYQAYPPTDRITKFSGEPKYEPEARAEVAISYLLHEWRDAQGAPVKPVPERRLFADAQAAKDFGAGPGLVAQQSRRAWAATVTKPGFVKFAWQPGHDDWLFDLGGTSPSLLPSTAQTVTGRAVRTYDRARDGFDAAASLLSLGSGYAGLTTLPSGAIVYATSGTAAGEGVLGVDNLTMPGVAGLDGTRRYRSADGAVTVPAQDAGQGEAPPAGVARVDRLTFAPTTARYVRMLGVTGHPTYGYSLFELEARDGADGANLARGGAVTASSFDPTKPPANVDDGSYSTRWAVSVADRKRGDSSIAVDLGTPHELDRVALFWETAAGSAYRVQTSLDGTTWTDVARYPHPDLSSTGNWLEVDGRAGLVVRGSGNPITVSGDRITLSDGPASDARGMLVEGYPGLKANATRRRAGRAPVTGGPEALRVSDAGGYLSVFDLSGADVSGTVSVAQRGKGRRLYAGRQAVTASGIDYDAQVAAATSRVEPVRFRLADRHGDAVPAGVVAEVIDPGTVRLTAPAGHPAQLVLTRARTGEARQVTVPGGQSRQYAF
ncbi:MAG TPA: discoidin domain-containing protein [Solirubrobacteraceae bacterium]|nr:discoidin domain-containing protein [Solirubrobacteraceae bacterium]